MIKTDNRHYNNTRSNKNLNIELDLWIRFKENGEKPILIYETKTQLRFGEQSFKIYYHPVDHCKTLPYQVVYNYNGENDSARFETISSAKYYIRKSK